jgi:acyl carrier protein
MEKSEIIGRLNTVFADVLDIENLALTENTTASDIEGWDSLAHVRLMIASEREFGIRFPTNEMAQLKNVGELVAMIVRLHGA